jgi:uncharacterized protein YjbJ (UPF0337 family)
MIILIMTKLSFERNEYHIETREGTVCCHRLKTNDMEKLIIKGDLNVLRGKLKQLYGNLRDDDLVFIKGKQEELIGRIQKKIGKTKRQVRELLAKLLRG